IGSKNAVTYSEIFRLFMEYRLWMGHGFSNGNAYFRVPDAYRDRFVDGVFDEETGLVKFRNVGWYTNLDTAKRHEVMTLYKKYTPDEFPTYTNYPAIEVSKVSDIPRDYAGAMGVPITFLDRHNPSNSKSLAAAELWLNPSPTTPNGGPMYRGVLGSMCRRSTEHIVGFSTGSSSAGLMERPREDRATRNHHS
ncbi:adenine-specific methyltransferase EcoRI family protein, partial [Microbacterium sp.]|uniref:adenine-specific methyltransferase EcoRI family protein n=1 Tax=Microbacterium sp. TaxID=51671 RepID=UPI0031FEDC0C|nr:adenine-specific methyltransferase EcoRI family protein [Microbacterium sp.]